MLEIIVPETFHNLPLKDFLRRYAGISLSLWRKIKHTGTVSVNGLQVTLPVNVQSGDVVGLTWQQESNLLPVAMPLSIIYEDSYLLVINKPPGLLVHPTTQEHTLSLANGVLAYYQQQNIACSFHPVHRLDRNTSGLILIAKFPHIQHMLSSANLKSIQRIYWALASGNMEQQQGIIDAPIGRSKDSIIQRTIDPDGQAAITAYKVLQNFPLGCLLELQLFTGRTHQIRVHLSSLGHPLWGDDLYGGSTALIQRHALHSYRMTFKHPVTGQILDLTTPLPEDMYNLMQFLDQPVE